MEKVLTDVRALADKDYVRVPYPPALAHLVKEAQAAWRGFYRLPPVIKESLGYLPDTNVSGVGYQGPEPGRDPKEHVHIRLNEAAWLRERCGKIDHPAVTSFIETALALAERLKPFGRDFVESAEQEFGIPHLVADTMSASDRWTIRFLHYLPGCGEEILAAEHTDKGPFTGHLYESDSGFELLTADGVWESIEFGGGETMVIAGIGLQYRSKCRLKAVVHQVRANERTAIHGRDSIVCFFEVDHTPHYDKPNHGPTQNHARKFRDMDFEEFSRYFFAEEATARV